MGIDRIGKNAPASVPPSPEGPAGRATDPTGRPFEVPATSPSSAAQPSARVESADSSLAKWKAGKIDLNGYLDAKVDEAVRHLGTLPAGQLEGIRRSMRERIAGDPTLMELVRTVTGRLPDPESDE